MAVAQLGWAPKRGGGKDYILDFPPVLATYTKIKKKGGKKIENPKL